MSKLSQTMKMVSGSTTYNVPFYTTTEEASAYGTYGKAVVGGTTCYYGLGTGTDEAHGSEVKTPLKVINDSTTYYMLTKGNAELATYNLVLAGTSNQTITLKYKNRNYTDTGYETEVTKTSTESNQTFTVRKGTTWTASVSANSGYNAGALSPGASGTVTANTTVSANAASMKTNTLTVSIPYGCVSVTVTYVNASGTTKTETKNAIYSAVTYTFAVKNNTNVTIVIRPQAGNYRCDVYRDGVYKGNEGTYTESNMTANHTWSAQYNVTCGCDG